MTINTETLYQIRFVYRLSLEELGTLVGVSKSHLHRVEKGERPLSDRLRQGLIEVLELDENKLQRIKNIYYEFTKRG
ncbi:helix-turn-helix transcriptional regulator [Aneurinibacillus aneurinilyticus]|uniref:helix-turn-helix domain-containing protein n=1 Tax=Aneurinibacillus aneurinilyticus TaxID=1391 RepID=UPI002E1F23A3|nr:helix-turn-helix transcriptional regulator [Aneurinibacillus aneurinilyticus]